MMAMALGSVQVAPFLYSNKGGRNRRTRLSPRVETRPLCWQVTSPLSWDDDPREDPGGRVYRKKVELISMDRASFMKPTYEDRPWRSS